MKKLATILILSLIFANQSFALQTEDEINEKIASVGFGKMFAVEPDVQIKKFFNDYEKTGNKHNIKKVRTFYDEKYVNDDGFDSSTYFDMVERTWESYPDLKYSYEIKKINVSGDYANVQTHETAKGQTKDASEYLSDKGLLESEAEVIYYLKKNGNRWVIISEETISEKTYLKYGEAKDIAFDIIAPYRTVAGQDYSVLFAADMPKSKIMLGSITNEKITYPAERAKEVFRKLGEDGILERFVTANSDGYNEQAVVSVGITSPEIDKEEMDLKLNVSGVAFLISRVNVVKPRYNLSNGEFKTSAKETKNGKN